MQLHLKHLNTQINLQGTQKQQISKHYFFYNIKL